MPRNKVVPLNKPSIEDVVEAIRYRFILTEMGTFFKQSKMASVNRHIISACEEIDRIWEENDFHGASPQLLPKKVKR